MPPAILAINRSFDDAVYGKVNLTAVYIPPAIFVIGKSVVAEINFAIFYIPPAVCVMSYGCHICSNLAIFVVIPVVAVCCFICKTIWLNINFFQCRNCCIQMLCRFCYTFLTGFSCCSFCKIIFCFFQFCFKICPGFFCIIIFIQSFCCLDRCFQLACVTDRCCFMNI